MLSARLLTASEACVVSTVSTRSVTLRRTSFASLAAALAGLGWSRSAWERPAMDWVMLEPTEDMLQVSVLAGIGEEILRVGGYEALVVCGGGGLVRPVGMGYSDLGEVGCDGRPGALL